MAEIEFLPLPKKDSEPQQVEIPVTAEEIEHYPGVEAKASHPIRLLTQEEIDSLAQVFADQGVVTPDPATSFLVGTVDAEGVTSFLCVQLMVHAEPIWIKPGNEHVLRGLIAESERVIAERIQPNTACKVFVFAADGKSARMAEVNGMERQPWMIYSKVVQSTAKFEEPPKEKKRVPIWAKERVN